MMKIAARKSPLSKAQVVEVMKALASANAAIPPIETVWLDSTGDKDQEASLKNRPRDDFFTKEIDECIIKGKAAVAVHSAKDLPETLDERLHVVALTRGVCSSDVLVMKEGLTFDTLPFLAKIGTSSHRRDEVISSLRPDLVTVDLRGSVDQRLTLITKGTLDGVVVAKAALIRLDLLHLNMMELPGNTTAHQGKLAIIARKDNRAAKALFASIDLREKLKKVVYFGLNPPADLFYTHHIPLIRTTPLPLTPLHDSPLREFDDYTHLVFTSKQGVKFFFEALDHYRLSQDTLFKKRVIAIGSATALELKNRGVNTVLTPREETQEGLASLIATLDVKESFFLLPGAARVRRHLTHFLSLLRIRFKKYTLYETEWTQDVDLVDMEQFDHYIFTSPSQVEAYDNRYKKWPAREKIQAIGPITGRKINFYL